MTTDEIRRAIDHSGKTKALLAEKLGMSRQAFSNRLARKGFSEEQLRILAHALGGEYHSYIEIDGRRYGC